MVLTLAVDTALEATGTDVIASGSVGSLADREALASLEAGGRRLAAPSWAISHSPAVLDHVLVLGQASGQGSTVLVSGERLKRLKDRLRPTVQELAYRLQLRSFFYRYEYMFTPRQLCFLCAAISEVRDVEGSVVEIGCASGNTAVFLNAHMDHEAIDKRYVCVDTFSGFTPSDIAFERQVRGKDVEGLDVFFSSNKRKWFEFTLDINGVDRAEVIEADVAALDMTRIGPVAFCLIDVDLYLPVRAALTGVFDALSPGGMIVVDDCFDHQRYDGAYDAYTEFTAAQSLPPTVVLGKLGIVRKAAPGQPEPGAPSVADA